MCENAFTLRLYITENLYRSTYLQNDSPRNGDMQIPSFLQGLGEHETNPEKEKKNLLYKNQKICGFRNC